MAGIVSSSLFEGNETTHSEELKFTFDIQSDHSDLVNTSSFSTENIHLALSGEIEFTRQNNTHYWRFLAMIVFLSGVFYAGVYSLDNSDRYGLSANIFDAVQETEAENLTHNKEVINLPPMTPVVTTAPDLEVVVEEKKAEEPKKAEVVVAIESKPEAAKAPENTKMETLSTEELPVNISAEPIKIQSYKTKSLAKAKRLSAKTGRYTFIKFGAEWCVPCKMMEATALKDEKVVDLLNDKFVVLEVDVDQSKGAKIKEEFYVTQLPTLIILDELGNQMRREEGGIGTIDLIEMLESVAEYIYLEEETVAASIDVGIQGR